MENNTSTLKVKPLQGETLLKELMSSGFVPVIDTNPYVAGRLKGNGLVVILYKSNSLVIQGNGDHSLVTRYLQPSTISTDLIPHLGSDEVGKGDYFGPLVIACAYIDEKLFDIVKTLGVMDSKKISDTRIVSIYNSISKTVPFTYKVVSPAEYNKGVKEFKNVSYFLASLHAEVASELVDKGVLAKYILVDQFSVTKRRLEDAFKGISIPLAQNHKAESDVAVALASVIARAKFLESMEAMSKSYGMTFPKGASNVISFGREFVKKYGQEELKNVAKVSFRTTSFVLSLF